MSAQLKRILPILAGAVVLAFAGTASATCGNGCHGGGGDHGGGHKPQPKPPVVNNHNKNINNNYNKNYNNNYNKNINNNNNYNKNINNVNVNVHSTNVAVATANANANANATGGGDDGGPGVFFSGGGAQVIATPGFPVLQPIGVARAEKVRKAFTEKRTVMKQVIVQAVCVDDRGRPHAASQIFAERDVMGHYKGEIFRCIAGTKLQATIAEFHGKVAFDGGQTMDCVKGEALWHEDGALTCRPAKPQRNCYERSLLRRHGAGYKVFQMTKVE